MVNFPRTKQKKKSRASLSRSRFPFVGFVGLALSSLAMQTPRISGKGMLSDVDVSVDVGFSPKKDQRGRTFDLPDVPNTVFAEVVVPIESDVEVIELRGSDEFERFVGVFPSERRQDVGENFANVFLLVA